MQSSSFTLARPGCAPAALATKKERMIASTKHPFNTPQGSFTAAALRGRKLMI
jgi:hypothetical protein